MKGNLILGPRDSPKPIKWPASHEHVSLVIKIPVAKFWAKWVLVGEENVMDIMFNDCFARLDYRMKI